MTLTIKIKMDNAAFDPDPEPETAYILRDLANRIAFNGVSLDLKNSLPLHDSNGNYVGEAKVTN